MTTRLQIYNGALLLLADRDLATLDEDREARRLLDHVWDDGGARYCLEQAQWHFAMRASRLDFNASIDPDWGFSRAFDKPADWVATSGVWQDEFMNTPLTQYADEVGFWFCDLDQIYVRYVSDHADFGANLADWPASFADYVKAYFASRIVHRMPGADSKREFLLGPPGRENKGWLNRTLLIAKNKAAMTQPATFPSRGTWAAARHRGRTSRYRDGGSTTQLIG